MLATTPVFANTVPNVPVPLPETSPVKVMVWSPVFMPVKFVPDTIPDAVTLPGVIFPSVKEIAGVVVGFKTVPLIPLAVVTDTEVTDPFDNPVMLEAGIVVE